MDTTTESKKRLALAIINFLSSSTKDGTLNSDETESIEVATQCIADAFKVDPTDNSAMSDALGGQTLVSIYQVFERMKGINQTKTAPKTADSSSESAGPSESERADAEALKAKGNAAMAQKEFLSAVDFYTQAINIVPTHAIYLSNRAAAYAEIGQHDKAIKDAEMAVDFDPSYGKAWIRLGHARTSVGDHRGAMEAYKAGLDAVPTGFPKLKTGYETAKKKVEEEESLQAKSSPSRDAGLGGLGGLDMNSIMSNMAGMMGNSGSSSREPGAGAGMPDLSKVLEMVQANPQLADMASKLFSQGGKMPDLGTLMSNPQVAAMAQSLLGGNTSSTEPGSAP